MVIGNAYGLNANTYIRMSDIPTIFNGATSAMDKAVNHTLHDFSSLHTGKASPSMVEGLSVHVESYGSNMQVKDLAAVTTPDPRLIQIQAWDRSTAPDIEKAIRKANLGFNPITEGAVIRIPIPELSKDRRKELVKVANGMAEQGRVSLRSARHDAMDALKKLKAEGHTSEDAIARAEKDVQSSTDNHVEEINKHLKAKEDELMQV